MVLKGLPAELKPFVTVITQKGKTHTFSEFKVRCFEETEKASRDVTSTDSVMKLQSSPYGGSGGFTGDVSSVENKGTRPQIATQRRYGVMSAETTHIIQTGAGRKMLQNLLTIRKLVLMTKVNIHFQGQLRYRWPKNNTWGERFTCALWRNNPVYKWWHNDYFNPADHYLNWLMVVKQIILLWKGVMLIFLG